MGYSGGESASDAQGAGGGFGGADARRAIVAASMSFDPVRGSIRPVAVRSEFVLA
jgi:hypothetical protein